MSSLGALKRTAVTPLRHALRSRREARTFTVAGGPGRGLWLTGKFSSGDYRKGGAELPVQRAIIDALHPGGVFYDVGANVGYFSMLAARAVGPSGQVYAFEALPWIGERIAVHSRLNGFANVRTFPVAVAEAPGKSRIRLTSHPGGATLEGHGTPRDGSGWLDVATVSIDTAIESGSLRRPDVVKIDVEGAELAVLQGMRTCLRDDAPVEIYRLNVRATGSTTKAKLPRFSVEPSLAAAVTTRRIRFADAQQPVETPVFD